MYVLQFLSHTLALYGLSLSFKLKFWLTFDFLTWLSISSLIICVTIHKVELTIMPGAADSATTYRVTGDVSLEGLLGQGVVEELAYSSGGIVQPPHDRHGLPRLLRLLTVSLLILYHCQEVVDGILLHSQAAGKQAECEDEAPHPHLSVHLTLPHPETHMLIRFPGEISSGLHPGSTLSLAPCLFFGSSPMLYISCISCKHWCTCIFPERW